MGGGGEGSGPKAHLGGHVVGGAALPAAALAVHFGRQTEVRQHAVSLRVGRGPPGGGVDHYIFFGIVGLPTLE